MSQKETNPRQSAGVAFVINKGIVTFTDLQMVKLFKGRAQAIKLNWNNQGEIRLINIYVPNQRNEHTFFWNTAQLQLLQADFGNPDFVLGDFNVTEEPIDRVPLKQDNTNAIVALRDAKNFLGVRDKWRHAFP